MSFIAISLSGSSESGSSSYRGFSVEKVQALKKLSRFVSELGAIRGVCQ